MHTSQYVTDKQFLTFLDSAVPYHLSGFDDMAYYSMLLHATRRRAYAITTPVNTRWAHFALISAFYHAFAIIDFLFQLH